MFWSKKKGIIPNSNWRELERVHAENMKKRKVPKLLSIAPVVSMIKYSLLSKLFLSESIFEKSQIKPCKFLSVESNSDFSTSSLSVVNENSLNLA